MPIDEEEWKKGPAEDSPEKRIEDFLEDRYPKAYSFDEINGRFRYLSGAQVIGALMRLEIKDDIESRWVSGETYYRADLDT